MLWVDAAKGLVSREIFASQKILQLEYERIFDRSWLFLAHETEIPKPGDFVTRMLGRVPVVVVRNSEGVVKAFLNSCRHRGTKVCRAESGNARNFVCPYHGWAYNSDGKLLTTTFDNLLPAETNLSDWGLVPVPKLSSYAGLIFGAWDPNAVDLPEYLGDFRFYLDLFFARTKLGMQVLAPPQRWRVKADWKVGALNFIGDGQHVRTTHIAPMTLGDRRTQVGPALDDSAQVIVQNGHGCTVQLLPSDGSNDYYRYYPEDLHAQYEGTLGEDRKAVLRRLKTCVGTVFPNLSFIEQVPGTAPEKTLLLRLWQPVAPGQMEILSWSLAEKEASDQYKEKVLRRGIGDFGFAGRFEQEDVELWESGAAASHNPVALNHPFNFQTSLPNLSKPVHDFLGPGMAYRPIDAEITQFKFMLHWDQLMKMT